MLSKHPSQFVKSDQGSFTIEASLVFPIIMLCTLVLLFFGMYVYQKVVVRESAQVAAERLAYSWDNSHKDVNSGNYTPGQTDGLYWRLTGDSASDLFGFLTGDSKTTVQVPSSQASSASTVEKKLSRVGELISGGLSGSATYTNHWIDRKVTVALQKPFHLPRFLFHWGGADTVQGQASSRVVDPVELIRLTNITRTYLTAIKGRISPQAAKEALIEPEASTQSGEQVNITSERQAAAYLRSLVNGSEKPLTTPSGTNRLIDALDQNGVAHFAFYTFTEPQLRSEQIPPDLELLKQGTQVKGIVWHFFKTKKSGPVGPSDKLRRELESKGIVVVIHN